MKFEIFDKDGLSDDPIGTIVIRIPSKPGRFTIQGGQVKTLSLVFE